MMQACVIVPALNAATTLGAVLDDLATHLPGNDADVIVVDDGSTDATPRVARDRGAFVVTHVTNLGKGAALRRGLEEAHARGKRVALTVDADGQHPAEDARRLLEANADEDALVLGVRDLERDGAPRANRASNAISNFFLSRFAGRALGDTQCGLRRYPVERTLALATRGRGYDFEAEVLLRAVWSGVEVVEVPIRVLYPPTRTTHFRIARDPWRIIRTVVAAVGDQRLRAPHDHLTSHS